MRSFDTIAAIATPVMTGAVGIVRVSGPESEPLLDACFRAAGGRTAAQFEPGRLYLGTFDCGGFSDRCMAVLFRAPKSFTGEDCAEIQCHGGVEVVRGVLKALLSHGARLAQPGEFTRRAFLNGKQDLSSCEGVGELIGARSTAEANAAGRLERGELFREVSDLQEVLTDTISLIEVLLDDPEEDHPLAWREEAGLRLSEARDRIGRLVSGYGVGRKVREGVTVVLCGRTNAGKSSLFNALLGQDRAIVTEIEGTTRDTIEAEIVLSGVRVRLVDTAGLRESGDEIERRGILRTREEMKNADLILWVADERGLPPSGLPEAGPPRLYVLNKIDMMSKDENFRRVSEELRRRAEGGSDRFAAVSARTGENLDRLREAIAALALGGIPSGLLITNERHYDALSRAALLIQEILEGFGEKTCDILALELRRLWDVLGEITGTTATEDIIDNIFRKFCLGK